MQLSGDSEVAGKWIYGQCAVGHTQEELAKFKRHFLLVEKKNCTSCLKDRRLPKTLPSENITKKLIILANVGAEGQRIIIITIIIFIFIDKGNSARWKAVRGFWKIQDQQKKRLSLSKVLTETRGSRSAKSPCPWVLVTAVTAEVTSCSYEHLGSRSTQVSQR